MDYVCNILKVFTRYEDFTLPTPPPSPELEIKKRREESDRISKKFQAKRENENCPTNQMFDVRPSQKTRHGAITLDADGVFFKLYFYDTQSMASLFFHSSLCFTILLFYNKKSSLYVS